LIFESIAITPIAYQSPIVIFSFLDHQALAFLSLIAPRITANQVNIQLIMKMSDLDENQVASVNQLIQICREKITTNCSIEFYGNLSSIQFLPGVDNKMKIIDCYEIKEWDIPILFTIMQFLASPRADGQQRVMQMHYLFKTTVQKLLDAIKEVCENLCGHVFLF
jgi:hypothetical protein